VHYFNKTFRILQAKFLMTILKINYIFWRRIVSSLCNTITPKALAAVERFDAMLGIHKEAPLDFTPILAIIMPTILHERLQISKHILHPFASNCMLQQAEFFRYKNLFHSAFSQIRW